jgi:hypothetical protein
MGAPPTSRVAVCAAACLLAAGIAAAQGDESRRIETRPALEIRPPEADAPSGAGDPVERRRPPLPPADLEAQSELDRKERRDAFKPRDEGISDALLIAVLVAGTALVILLVVVRVSRRNNA